MFWRQHYTIFPDCLSSCLTAYLLACLPAYKPACLLACLPVYLPICYSVFFSNVCLSFWMLRRVSGCHLPLQFIGLKFAHPRQMLTQKDARVTSFRANTYIELCYVRLGGWESRGRRPLCRGPSPLYHEAWVISNTLSLWLNARLASNSTPGFFTISDIKGICRGGQISPGHLSG